MKPSGREDIRTRAGWAGVGLALATCAWASTSAPSPPSAADAIAAGQAAVAQLRQMRVRRDTTTASVAAALRKAMGRLDEVDKALAEELEKLPEQRPPARPRPESPSRGQQIHTARCRIAWLRGELYTAAATALPVAEKARRGYLDLAISTYRSLRVLYLDVPLAWLGYLGEARAQRLSGRLAAAREALTPILEMARSPGDGLSLELRRAAMLETLEIDLADEPAKAITPGRDWRKSADVAGEPTWEARVDWVLARAHAAEAARLKQSRDRPDAAKDALARSLALLRSQAVAKVAPLYDRLALLAQLDELAGGTLMTRAERLQWADALAALGSPDAVASYRRAAAMPGGPLSARQQYRCAVLLWQTGDWAAVADACDALLKAAGRDAPQRNDATRLRAAALLKLYRQHEGGTPPADVPARLLSALEAVVESDLPEALRRDALRQWASARSRAAGLGACAGMLARHRPLVGQDAYLLYTRAAATWAQLSGRASAEQARQIAAECEAARRAAERAARADLAARSALLKARVLAPPPLGDPRAALEVLTGASALLGSEKVTSSAAAWLRVELLLDLGLTDSARKILADMGQADSAGSVEVLIRAAEALSGRYAAGDLVARRQIVELCNRAMASAVGDEGRYAAVAGRSARAMLNAGAHADARGILNKLSASKAVQGDPGARLSCSLMLAEALQQGGKYNEAESRLKDLVERSPRSAAAWLALGRLQMAVKRPAVAVEHFRRARKLTRPGSADWCRATLALAEGLHAQGHAVAAADVVRVSRALYPAFGGPELLRQLKQLADELSRPAAPTPSRQR